MKAVFDAAGVPCARSRRVASGQEAIAFASDVGYPFVAKPLAGAGARNTFRVDGDARLGEWLATSPPSDAQPMLLEEFMTGQEHSFDSVVIGGEMVWHSISRYLPSPLDVLEHPWIQWCVLLPRRIDDQGDIAATAGRALQALGLRDGLSHMEWFRRPDGSVAISEVGARPPGSQFMTLMSYAHDTDLYAAWARLVVDGVVRSARALLRLRRRLPASPGIGPHDRRHRGARPGERGDAVAGRRGQPPAGAGGADRHVRRRRLHRGPRPRHRGCRGGARTRSSPRFGWRWRDGATSCFLGPSYPSDMPLFTRGLASVGARVIGVGDQHADALPHRVREALTDYVRIDNWFDEAATVATVLHR